RDEGQLTRGRVEEKDVADAVGVVRNEVTRFAFEKSETSISRKLQADGGGVARASLQGAADQPGLPGGDVAEKDINGGNGGIFTRQRIGGAGQERPLTVRAEFDGQCIAEHRRGVGVGLRDQFDENRTRGGRTQKRKAQGEKEAICDRPEFLHKWLFYRKFRA